MRREIIITSDGSTTIYLPEWNEHYHSKHGAIQEAYHVFIKNGLACFNNKQNLSILEIGFGTGLNCFITYLEAVKNKIAIDYIGVDAYPISKLEVEKLNYVTELQVKNEEKIFNRLHTLSWEEKHQLTATFSLIKKKQFFKDIIIKKKCDLIYFDAFGAQVQPELWTVKIFKKMYNLLRNKGVLVTYSAKGSVRRAMQEVGFSIERLQGPPRKREMLRATKNI